MISVFYNACNIYRDDTGINAHLDRRFNNKLINEQIKKNYTIRYQLAITMQITNQSINQSMVCLLTQLK